MPNLKIPAVFSYETTIEEKNRWLKPFGKRKKKKKRLSTTFQKRNTYTRKYRTYFRPYLIDTKIGDLPHGNEAYLQLRQHTRKV